MGKIYNIVLNSINATNYSTSLNNNLNFYIDWLAILPKKPLKLTWSYMAGQNYISGQEFPYLTLNLNSNLKTYITGSLGAPSTQIIGSLRQSFINQGLFIGTYCASITDNPPIYLDSPPTNNNINVSIYSNLDNNLFLDNFYTPVGGGTITQAGNILIVASQTTGQLNVGTAFSFRGSGTISQIGFVITIITMPAGAGLIKVGTQIAIAGFSTVTITSLGSGTGSTGTYNVDNSQSIAGTTTTFVTNYFFNTITGFNTGSGGLGSYFVQTAYTYTGAVNYITAAVNGGQPANYMLNLSFEEIDHN